MTYKGSGVDYDAMDPFKVAAQKAARSTAINIERLNGGEFREFGPSRGESVYLIEAARSYFAHVEEGLGTKNLVADAMYALTGKSYYDHIAQDTVAMIVNDMATLGAMPLSVAMHLAVGDSGWFEDTKRSHDLVNGWKVACNLSGCAWGGGETPTLKGIINPETVVLSGSAMGIIKPKERLIQGNIEHDDAIIVIESSGIHANGLTLARQIAEKLPEGYLTKLPNGRSYGETLLDPTPIYAVMIKGLLDSGIDIHYTINVTGHGWRKFMRAEKPFTYVIESLPRQLPIFRFIQKHGPVDDYEAYQNFNMGAGFALYVPQHEVPAVRSLFDQDPRFRDFSAYPVGHIEETEDKKVVIQPRNLVYTADTLALR